MTDLTGFQQNLPQQNFKSSLLYALEQPEIRRGLLNMGASMLANNGWTDQPKSFGQSFGQGLLGFQQGVDQHNALQQRQGLFDMKKQEYQNKLLADKQAEMQRQAFISGLPENERPFATAYPEAHNKQLLETHKSTLPTPEIRTLDALLGSPERFAGKERLNESKAAKTQIDNKIDVNTAKGISAQIGPMLSDSKGAAQGAIDQMGAVDRMQSALDSGNLYIGPGANVRLGVARLGDFLGITGKDTEDKITNTRKVIQGTAEFALQARGMLKGQGVISDKEQAVLERARSVSDISNITAEELQIIIDVSRRAAKAKHEHHQNLLENAAGVEGAESLVPFFSVPDLPGQSGQVLKYNPETGEIE